MRRIGLGLGLLLIGAGCTVESKTGYTFGAGGTDDAEVAGAGSGGKLNAGSGSAGRPGSAGSGGESASSGGEAGIGAGGEPPVVVTGCQPSELRCEGLVPQTCDATGNWQENGATCATACMSGVCVDLCAEGDQACNGLQPQACDAEGHWQIKGAACDTICSGKGVCGVCTPSMQRCSDRQPQTCDAAGSWQNNGPACTSVCSDGACSGSCVPASKRCNGLQPEVCSAAGVWQNSGTACPNVCSDGACGGTCSPTSKQCKDLQPQLCDATGQWQNSGAACAVCNGGTCLACSPGAVQCNSLQPQTCDASGKWQNTGIACPNLCSAGVCTGTCKPTTVQCDGLKPQKCSAQGAWQDNGAACTFLCAAGSCTGVCKPNDVSCNGLQPRKCDTSGAWQNVGAKACDYVCVKSTGTCTGNCSPTSKKCNGLQPQTCDSNGVYQNTGSACDYVCANSTGTCTGTCSPTAKKCNGLQPQTCDANGLYQNTGNACPNVCKDGSCTGECKPGALDCASSQPRKCDANGFWQLVTTCGVCAPCDTTAPTIVSISPANLATGVKLTAQIKITFSEVMNAVSASQALLVGGFAASNLNTSWDASGKVLTVTPKAGFAYATGSSAAGTPATKYTVSVGTGATDLAGNPLGSAFNSSFTTLRRITQSIASGVAATYSTYGNAVGGDPQSCPANDPIWVETWTSIASGGTYYVFAPFDTTVMGNASNITLESATFSATQVAPSGAFYSSHQVVLKRVKPQAIDNTVLSAAVIDSFGVFASSAVTQPTANVFSELSIDIAAGVRQELFRLEPTGTADGGTNANFTCSGFYLNVVFLTP
jgi:Bacterial Ig-like domain